MASVDHVLVLLLHAALECEDVQDGLVIHPPFGALYVLLHRAH
jgi:hypothetical protein